MAILAVLQLATMVIEGISQDSLLAVGEIKLSQHWAPPSAGSA